MEFPHTTGLFVDNSSSYVYCIRTALKTRKVCTLYKTSYCSVVKKEKLVILHLDGRILFCDKVDESTRRKYRIFERFTFKEFCYGMVRHFSYFAFSRIKCKTDNGTCLTVDLNNNVYVVDFD